MYPKPNNSFNSSTIKSYMFLEVKFTEMETRKIEYRQLLKDKRVWFASFIITWAAALQGHMMWVQRQDSFKHKFGTVNQQLGSEETAESQL